MSLERGIGSVIDQGCGDVLFPMSDGASRIFCKVTADALHHLTRGRYRTVPDAFASVRLHIETIASIKYDEGLLEEDGSVTVTRTDLSA